jgi:hypothetical protein
MPFANVATDDAAPTDLVVSPLKFRGVERPVTTMAVSAKCLDKAGASLCVLALPAADSHHPHLNDGLLANEPASVPVSDGSLRVVSLIPFTLHHRSGL